MLVTFTAETLQNMLVTNWTNIKQSDVNIVRSGKDYENREKEIFKDEYSMFNWKNEN